MGVELAFVEEVCRRWKWLRNGESGDLVVELVILWIRDKPTGVSPLASLGS